jgi:signal transduction histidine kinase
MAPLARQQGLEVSVGELHELLVNGDRLYLTRMLVNIVENAIKYGKSDSNWIRVEAGRREDACAWLRVADGGRGIPPEHLPHVFDRFYRVDASRGRDAGVLGGSGLGLAIVRWVATAHGGDVHVTSQLGRGSTFEIRLPLLREAATARAARGRAAV